MSNLTYSNSDNLKNYLAFLDATPLLERKEEIRLLKLIAKERKSLFKKCFELEIFQKEVALELTKLGNRKLKEVPKNSPLYIKTPQPSVTAHKKMLFKWGDNLQQEGYSGQVKANGNVASLVLAGIKAKHRHMQDRLYLNRQCVTLGLVDTLPMCMEWEEYTPGELFKRLKALVLECLRNPEMLEMLRLNNLDSPPASQFKRKLQRIDSMLAKFYKEHKLTVPDHYAVQLSTLSMWIENSEARIRPVVDPVINANLRLVVARARYLPSSELEFEDLVQYGNIGLMKALRKYDLDIGVKFGTYATWWIDQALQRAVANRAKVIRVPTHVQVLLSKISKLKASRVGKDLTEQELAEALEVSEAAINSAVKSQILAVGLETESQGEYSLNLDVNSRQTDLSDNPFQLTSEKLVREKLRKAMRTLPPLTEMILRLKYGIGEPLGRGISSSKISTRLKVTKSSVSSRLARAKKSLKRKAFEYGLR